MASKMYLYMLIFEVQIQTKHVWIFKKTQSWKRNILFTIGL